MTTLAWPTAIDPPLLRSRRIGTARLVILAAFACGLCGRLVFLAWPFDSDAAMFVYLGKSVCAGDRFGHDVVDNKFPTVGLMTSVLWRAFGTHWAGYVITQAAMAVGGSILLARTASRHISQQAGLATLAAALIYLNFTPCVFGGFQLETGQLFFATISACAAIEMLNGGDCRDAFLVGLAAGCAALLKPTGVAPLAALAVILIVRRDRRRLMWIAIGLVPPLCVATIYMTRTNVLLDLPAIARQISDYASHTPLRWEDALKPLTVLLFVGVGMLVRGWVFRRHSQGRWPGKELSAFVGCWFVFELVGALAQRRMYAYHFLPIAPPAALLFGMIPRKTVAIHLVAALGPVAAVSILAAATLWRSAPRDSDDALRDYVSTHTQPSDAIWMDNCPRLLLETDRRLGGRIPLTFIFGNTDESAIPDAATLINDLSIRRPALIFLPDDMEKRIVRDQRQTLHLLRSPLRAENYAMAWRMIAAFVRQNYAAGPTIDHQTAWLRK